MKRYLLLLISLSFVLGYLSPAFALSANDLRMMMRNNTNAGNLNVDMANPNVNSLIGYDTTSTLGRTDGGTGAFRVFLLGSGLSYNTSTGTISVSGISQSDITGLTAALAGKEPTITAGTNSQYYRGDKTFQTLNSAAVGLGSVDNTSDADKPISTDTQAALDDKFDVPTGSTAQYVRGNGSLATFPTALSSFTNDTAFITSSALSPYLTTTTAATTYVPQTTTINGHALSSNVSVTKGDVGLGNADNTSDANKPVSTATQTALNGKFNSPAGTTAQYLRGDGTTGTFPTNLSAFTNGPGYLTSSDLSPYLTSATAASTYFPIPTGTTAQYIRGNGTLATLPTPGSRSWSTPSRVINTCFQIDASKDADFHYKVDVSTGLSLTNGAQGTVTATSYTNSGCTTGAAVEADGTSAQTGTLIVGLGINQTSSVSLDGTLQGGKWLKITTANTVGTPSFAIRANQREVVLP